MFRDDLGVELVELDEVRVAKAKVLEQLRAFDILAAQQKVTSVQHSEVIVNRHTLCSFGKRFVQGCDRDGAAL